jgi:hypothetical protein
MIDVCRPRHLGCSLIFCLRRAPSIHGSGNDAAVTIGIVDRQPETPHRLPPPPLAPLCHVRKRGSRWPGRTSSRGAQTSFFSMNDRRNQSGKVMGREVVRLAIVVPCPAPECPLSYRICRAVNIVGSGLTTAVDVEAKASREPEAQPPSPTLPLSLPSRFRHWGGHQPRQGLIPFDRAQTSFLLLTCLRNQICAVFGGEQHQWHR